MQFITEARAQEANVSSSSNAEFSFSSFIPLILIFAVFYFLIIRPQTKKMKQHQEMVNNLKIGTKIITNSGIVATIKALDEKENIAEIEIAEGVRIKILRNYISELQKTESKEKIKKGKKS